MACMWQPPVKWHAWSCNSHVDPVIATIVVDPVTTMQCNYIPPPFHENCLTLLLWDGFTWRCDRVLRLPLDYVVYKIPACPWVSSFRGLIVKLLKYGPQFHILPFKKMDVMDIYVSQLVFSEIRERRGPLSPVGMVREYLHQRIYWSFICGWLAFLHKCGFYYLKNAPLWDQRICNM